MPNMLGVHKNGNLSFVFKCPTSLVMYLGFHRFHLKTTITQLGSPLFSGAFSIRRFYTPYLPMGPNVVSTPITIVVRNYLALFFTNFNIPS